MSPETFGNAITQFELVRSDGTRKLCSANQEPLTSTPADRSVVSASHRLHLLGDIAAQTYRLPHDRLREGIQFHGIDEFLDLTNQSKDIEYTVSWVDVTSTGRNFCRGIFMGARRSLDEEGRTQAVARTQVSLPVRSARLRRSTPSASASSTPAFFHKQIHDRVVALQDYEPFFLYPLDKVLHWNRMYGKGGLLQFKYVIRMGTRPRRHSSDPQGGCQVRPRQLPRRPQAFGDVPSPGLMKLPQARHHARARLPHQARTRASLSSTVSPTWSSSTAAASTPPKTQP